MQDGEAYSHLLTALAPELSSPSSVNTNDPTERANMVLAQAEKLECKKFLTAKDIVDGSPNLNLAFVAQIFQHRLAMVTGVIIYIIKSQWISYCAQCTCQTIPTSKHLIYLSFPLFIMHPLCYISQPFLMVVFECVLTLAGMD